MTQEQFDDYRDGPPAMDDWGRVCMRRMSQLVGLLALISLSFLGLYYVADHTPYPPAGSVLDVVCGGIVLLGFVVLTVAISLLLVVVVLWIEDYAERNL